MFNIKDYELGKRPLLAIFASVFIFIMLALFIGNAIVYGEGLRLLPVYSVETEDKKAAITFNCAWSAEDIPKILSILEKYDAKATFFILGQWAKDNPSAVKAIYEAGHEIGNHSNTHPDMAKLSPDEIRLEISKAKKHIEEAGATCSNFFRAPSGSYSNTLIETAYAMGFMPTQWDIDSRDWKGYTPEKMISSVTKNTQKGSIILFHCGKENTLAALPHILETLKNMGYEFVTVGDLIYTENYSIDRNGRQYKVE